MENTYLYLTLSLAAVAFSSFVMYDEERMKSSRFALGIISLAALLIPLVSLVRGTLNVEFSYTDTTYPSSAVTKTLEAAFADGISDALEDEFSINDEDIEVRIFGFDEEKMTADEISVTLSGRAAAKDLGRIEDYVTELGLGKCVLEVRIG